MRTQTLLMTAALALSAPLAACASEGYGAPGYGASGYANGTVAAGYGEGVHHEDDGLLPEPPANAKAGQCFAKVVVPGQPVYGPPSGPHLKWVQSPPPPGAIGPVWCQVWEAGYQPTVTMTPERFGWIRVICDKDATKDKIGHIQHRLHDWGYYQGGYGGEYDAATAEAVKRFQSERHIEHGGYLSFKTMEALDGAPPPPPAPVAPPATYAQGYQGGGFQAYAFQQQTYVGPQLAPPVYQQPVFQPPVYQPCPVACQQPAPPPCGPAPCQAGGYPQPPVVYGQGGYGYSQGSNVRRYSVQRTSW